MRIWTFEHYSPHFRVILHVSDIDATDRFYQHLLGRPVVPVTPGRHYVHCGGVILALVDPAREEGFAPRPGADNLYFSVGDLGEVFGRARALE